MSPKNQYLIKSTSPSGVFPVYSMNVYHAKAVNVNTAKPNNLAAFFFRPIEDPVE
jgi:hypothetical protein